VCCQLEVSATGLSLVRMGPTECGASVCDLAQALALYGRRAKEHMTSDNVHLLRHDMYVYVMQCSHNPPWTHQNNSKARFALDGTFDT
jgi:hypothetical protein